MFASSKTVLTTASSRSRLCLQQSLIDGSKTVKPMHGGSNAMDVAIIGAGNVGGALARSFVRSGHAVTITARTAGHASQVADATGAKAVATNAEAAGSADV